VSRHTTTTTTTTTMAAAAGGGGGGIRRNIKSEKCTYCAIVQFWLQDSLLGYEALSFCN
jgi:hypothetical protein